MPPRTFKSGEIAPVSGIYLTYHSTSRLESDEVFVERSKPFPCCLNCLRQITFKLLVAMEKYSQKQEQ
jgi:hypothetical protein